MANIKEVTAADISSLTYNRQQIRWSSATDVTSFAAADYLYLPYASGAIRKLLNIQHILIVYLGDAIFYGVPSNVADLPYTFSRLGTSGVGLTGPKSIVPYMNAHFFVGQDDIYFLDASMQFDRERNRIGTPVVRETIEQCSDLTKVYACLDTLNSRLLFGFPRDGNTIERIWSFDYKAKSWSYDEVDATFLASPQINLGLAWTDLPGILSADTWTGLGTDFATWGALAGVTSQSRVYAGQSGYIFQYSDNGATDNGVAIPTEIESGDIDLDLPSADKTWLRLSVKLEARPSAALAFAVETSMDGGNTWTSQGTLSIAATKREGFLDMTATGSAMRYRLTSSSNVQSYVVTEVVWRVIKRGPESEVD